MTTKNSQSTTNGSQNAAELHRQIEALGQELRQKVAECDKLRADIADILLMPSKEAVADLVHNQWTGWMKYLFSKCEFNDDGTVTIPAWAVERWKRQTATVFLELPSEEKETDLAEAKKVISAFSVLPKETEHRLLVELTEERQQRIESNALLFAAARALGMDDSEVDELPQKVAEFAATGSLTSSKWTVVMKALGALYEAYYQQPTRYQLELKELLDAYDEWLD